MDELEKEADGNDISCKSETERVGQIIPTCLGRKSMEKGNRYILVTMKIHTERRVCDDI